MRKQPSQRHMTIKRRAIIWTAAFIFLLFYAPGMASNPAHDGASHGGGGHQQPGQARFATPAALGTPVQAAAHQRFATQPPPAGHQAAPATHKREDIRESREKAGVHGKMNANQASTALILWVTVIGAVVVTALLAAALFKTTAMMDFLDRMKVAARIAGIVSILLIATALVAATAITMMNDIGEELAGIAERDLPLIENLTAITEHQLEMAIWMERGLARSFAGDMPMVRHAFETMTPNAWRLKRF